MRRLTLLLRAAAASLLAVISLAVLPASPVAAESQPTYQAQVLNDAHIDRAERLYRAVLGREAEPEGAAYWGGLLAEGYAIESIASHLLASDE